MTFLANDSGKPARTVVFGAVGLWLATQVLAVYAGQTGMTIPAGWYPVAAGVAVYVLERLYRQARKVPVLAALDPWTEEPETPPPPPPTNATMRGE